MYPLCFPEVNGTYLVPLSQEADEHASYDQQNGTIVVKERGLYYIFSQVPFRYNDGTSNKTQFLYRIRNDGEELLLENSVYPCGANPRGCMQSFVGGTFLLDSGDRLCLRVSDHQCLDDRRKVEFGVQRI
ncbi:hypothetical protein BaRGS_00024298 [Batillaria attramentaria]|uniref:THD domain-containing protein n=1 Tax=Batillaria attramentaria TaxID=370345 RepID=A0ABD0KBC8_9CAEN